MASCCFEVIVAHHSKVKLATCALRALAARAALQAQEIFIQESFARQPFAEGIILKTKRGARFQPAARKWKAADDTGSQPFLRITETHGDSVLTLPADSQVLGTSTAITNEIFTVGKNMLCYQSVSNARSGSHDARWSPQ